MPTLTLTLNVPEPIYRNLKRRANDSKRTIEEETVIALATAMPDDLSEDLTNAISALHTLDDADLWNAARYQLPLEASTALEALHQKKTAREYDASGISAGC